MGEFCGDCGCLLSQDLFSARVIRGRYSGRKFVCSLGRLGCEGVDASMKGP